MNRQWTIPLVVAMVAGLVAYGVTTRMIRARGASPVDRLQDVGLLTRELGLRSAQAREIKALQVGLGETLNDCCARHCGARARLAQALITETNGNGAADAILAEMCQAYEQSERAAMEQIRRVRATLSVEQRKRFDVMIAACMCSSCGVGAGCGEAGK